LAARSSTTPTTTNTEIDTLILCGGLGTRLRPAVSDRPKALVEIGGRPFLDVLIDELVRCGLHRFVLCTGYGSEQIAAHFRGRGDAEYALSAEDRPLGTGGAVVHALPLTQSDPIVVVNGDSFCRVNYAELLDFHRRKCALLTIVAAPPAGRDDAGAIRTVDDGRIVEFAEKPGGDSGRGRLVNAGIYVMQRKAADFAPHADSFSLERELFPAAVGTGRCFVFSASGPLVDIGTPERLHAAQEQIRGLESNRGDRGSINS
jgi:D-glycero-alpha-D-manno-heptose 1-phosphate guanylyltransferase